MSFSNLRSQRKNEPKKEIKKKPPRPPRSKSQLTEKQKSDLLEEIGKLLECLGYGHKHFEKLPELKITDSSEIKPRIFKNIYLLMK